MKGVEQYSGLLNNRRTMKGSSSGLGFGNRCLTIVKQQRTRFYILRRCATMLLCWHAHAVRD